MKTDEIGKLLPQNIEIESAVLGMFMFSPACCIHIPLLNENSFYKLEHQLIFRAINTLHLKSITIETLSVITELKKMDVLKSVGGISYVSRLTTNIVNTVNIENYCLMLLECETARNQINFANELMQMAFDPTNDVFKTNEFMADMVGKISQRTLMTKEINNEQLASELIDRMYSAKQKLGITGVRSGYHQLDKLTGGWQKTDLIILAARPSMGKTALALCYARNAVVIDKKRVAIFSLEMSAAQLFSRLTAIHVGLHASKIKNGELTDGEWKIFNDNLQPILTDDLIIIDDCYDLKQIIMRAKKERMKKQIDLIIIDYLQLISYSAAKNREQEISTISRLLKLMAKELDVPVIALSQLSRAVEQRSNKRPMLSDLRESGSIEQDADIVQFLYRPSYYDENTTENHDAAYVCIEKHRNGELQDINLRYIAALTKFVDYNEPELPY